MNNIVWNTRQSSQKDIGVISEDFNLLPDKSVFDNLALEIQGSNIQEDVLKTLAFVDLANYADRFPRQLAGGEKQRLSLARVLIHKPKVLLAVEPTYNLDDFNKDKILRLLEKIQELGIIVILVTNNQEIADSVKNYTVLLAHKI